MIFDLFVPFGEFEVDGMGRLGSSRGPQTLWCLFAAESLSS